MVQILAMLACGLTIVLAVGEFDFLLQLRRLWRCVAAVLVARAEVPLPFVVLAVIAAGLTIGLVNGYLVSKFDIPALIATIAVSSLLDGLTLWVTGNSVIFTGFTSAFMAIGGWRLLISRRRFFTVDCDRSSSSS